MDKRAWKATVYGVTKSQIRLSNYAEHTGGETPSRARTLEAGERWAMPGEGKGYLLQYSCLENSMDRGAWWATVHGVAKSWTQLSDVSRP